MKQIVDHLPNIAIYQRETQKNPLIRLQSIVVERFPRRQFNQ